MNTKKQNPPEAGAAGDAVEIAAQAEVQHKEPQGGGSYIRNVTTGELEQVAGPVADQPEKE